MRHFTRMGIVFVSILCLGIIVTPAAQAGELKLLPEHLRFHFKLQGVGWKFGTLGGKKLECLSATGSGEATSERLGKFELKLAECSEPVLKVACTGLSDTTGHITISGEYHLRHLLPASGGVSMLLLGSAHLICLGVLFTLNGCLASGDLLTTSNENVVNRLVGAFLASFSMISGDASVTSISLDNGLGMESCILLSKQEINTAESSGWEFTIIIEKCEAGGFSCTYLIDLSGTP